MSGVEQVGVDVGLFERGVVGVVGVVGAAVGEFALALEEGFDFAERLVVEGVG